MAKFSIKTWVDRAVEFAGRRILTATGNANEYDITRSEGTVFTAGNKPDATELNDLEQRISDGLDYLSQYTTGVLTAGQTSITITDSRFTATSILEYTTDRAPGDNSPFGINPTTAVKSAGQHVLTFPVQTFNMTVGAKIRGYV